MVRTRTVSAVGHAQCQNAHAAEIHVHGQRGFPTREQAAPPKDFSIAADDELDTALTARTVIQAHLREEAARSASEVHAQPAFSVSPDAASKRLPGNAEGFTHNSKISLGNAPTAGHPR